jgi:hypothetical protein
MNAVNNRKAVSGLLFVVLSVVLLPFATANAEGWDYIESYYPESDYIETYYPEYDYDYVETYYPEDDYDYVETYYPESDYDYIETYYPEYDYVETYYPTYSSYPSYGYGGGYGGYGGSSIGYSRPISYGYPSTPVTFSAPTTYRAPAPTPAPAPTTISNVNNNTNVNNVVNNNNSSAVAIATVTPIAAAPVQYPVQYVQSVISQQPYCTITISHYGQNAYGPYAQNQLATLTWSSSNASSGYISPNIGTVSGYGSMQVYPTNGQIYTMTVYGQGGQATCSTQPFYVAPVVTYQNPTPYVSLSQIPYTGLDLGVMGNIAYWFSMVTFAGAAAYLVLYFNGGALAVLGARRAPAQIALPKITVSHPVLSKVEVPVHAAHAEAPVISPIQLATSKATSDTMKLEVKPGETPRIVISRS